MILAALPPVRRLARIALAHSVNDLADRNTMPMSTVIGSSEWLMEAPWDGHTMGDVVVFRNENFRNGQRRMDPISNLPMSDEWKFWNGIPRSQVTAYFWAEDFPEPSSEAFWQQNSQAPVFELGQNAPSDGAEFEEKPGRAREARR